MRATFLQLSGNLSISAIIGLYKAGDIATVEFSDASALVCVALRFALTELIPARDTLVLPR